MQNISLLKDQLVGNKRIVIVVHERPDADALGSSLALALFLSTEGHKVTVVSPTMYPEFLSWLPGIGNIIIAKDYTQEALLEKIGPIDILFCVDFSNSRRLGGIDFLLQLPHVFKVVIDHHLEPDIPADLFFWDIQAAASAEIVFQLLEDFNAVEKLTKDMATCLYVGIMTDTNSFKNSHTTAKTHRIAAALMDCHIEASTIQRLVYDNKPLNSLHFFSFAISQRLVVLPELKTAYFVVQKEDYKRYDLKSGDTEGLVDYALSLKGIVLAAVLKEEDDGIYVSLRSLGNIPVNLIAKTYFQGGGHKNAAGGRSILSLTETVDLFEQILKSDAYKSQYKL